MLTLRKYQQNLVEQVIAAWEKHRSVMIQLPTGGGKTQCFVSLALPFIKEGKSVLVIAHREELLDQAYTRFMGQLSEMKAIFSDCLSIGFIKAGRKLDYSHKIQIASIQTIARRKNIPHADLIIIDEAHHATCKSYTTVIEKYKDAKILGVTATPCRTDGQGFNDYFDTLVLGESIDSLINQGYLSEYRLFGLKDIIVTKKRKEKKEDSYCTTDYTNTDYTNSELKVAIGDIRNVGFIKSYEDYGRGQNLVFTSFVEDSITVVNEYRKNGYSAAHLDGTTPTEERTEILDRFKKKEINIVSNVGILTEGFDIPDLDMVQILKPTKSLILWLQMVGRVLRPAEGKEYAIIIDHTDNFARLGLPNEDHLWSLYPQSLSPLEVFTKYCGNCNHVFRPLPHELKPLRDILNIDESGNFDSSFICLCPVCKTEITWKQSSKDIGGSVNYSEEIKEEILIEVQRIKIDLKQKAKEREAIELARQEQIAINEQKQKEYVAAMRAQKLLREQEYKEKLESETEKDLWAVWKQNRIIARLLLESDSSEEKEYIKNEIQRDQAILLAFIERYGKAVREQQLGKKQAWLQIAKCPEFYAITKFLVTKFVEACNAAQGWSYYLWEEILDRDS